ncbi:MAG: S9 family peptidase, partial [Erythrobacter sp.]
MFARFFLATACLALASTPLAAQDTAGDDAPAGPETKFTGADLFGLSVAADPQISPDGEEIAYVRRTNDIMTDRAVSSIWL